MSWFKVDDGFFSSRKVLSIPKGRRLAAIGLWTMAGAWCAKELTDGVVPEFVIEELGGTQAMAEALATAGLWSREGCAFVFTNWLEYQPARDSVEGQRAASRQRQAEWRAKKAGVTKESQRDTGVSNGVTDALVTPVSQHPDPTRPDPTRPDQLKNLSSPRGEGAFAEFYMAYPRKVGKEAARKKFIAIARKVDPQLIIEGARRFAADPNLPEKQYVPHPATWLNAGRWDDEPLPPREGGLPVTPLVEPGNEWMQR
ncbi:hypothetical protein [Subtercola sp. YIM 133946]|uniref:hypothetical protein n=1 Tax=Subtercola sp. YIM 133946 TaxID=3118909 RepID=UPI002F91CECC